MVMSEQINELATALAKAQGQMEGAKKDSENPFFKSKYADLAAVVEAIRGPFAEHGLAYVQLPEACEGEAVAVTTLLLHSSGQWVSSRTVVPVSKADAQGVGSALTYARRYGLQAIAGVAAEDDDGNRAVEAAPKPKRSHAVKRMEPADFAVQQTGTIDEQAAALFPDEPHAQPDESERVNREALLALISAESKRLKMAAKDRALLWTQFVSKTNFDPRTADVAALSDLLEHLRGMK